MKSKSRILAIIPCRKGSKRLKNKHILPINGKPMFLWTLEMIEKSKLIDSWCISTDIKELLNHYGVIGRPKHLCTDKSPLDDTLRHIIQEEKKRGKEYDLVVMCHCNIPIRKEGEIDKLIKIALKNPEATSVVSGVEVSEPVEWQFERDKSNGTYYFRPYQDDKFRKQDMPKRYNCDGAIQVHRIDALIAGTGEAYSYFGDKIIIAPHEKRFSLEIDTQDDYDYVEYLMHKDNL